MTRDSGEDWETCRLDAVVDSLSEVVTPLTSVAPDDPLEELDVIGDAIGDADVIGMGEASHGTREFFQFKHRLFRYLVQHHGVRMLGLEANFAGMLAVNEYVLEGKGSAVRALSQDCIYGSYQNESVLALIEWIREFNQGRHPDDKIRFHGFDVQDPSAACARLESHFEKVEPETLAEVSTPLEQLIDEGIPDLSDDEALNRHLDAREAVVSTLEEAIETNETAHVNATSRSDVRRVKRLIWMIDRGREQFVTIQQGRAESGANIRVRDSAMAAQVQWLLRHEPADEIALWGHNAHLTRGAFGGGTVRHKQGIPSLGKNLALLDT
ncbi:MAG: erythromycin esterase family protein, partial [Halobacteriaceae archaeon]